MTSLSGIAFAPRSNCLRGRNGDHEGPFARLCSCLHLRNAQLRDSEQVVCGTGNEGRHLSPRLADETGLSQSADRFQPTEDLLDALSLSLAELVALGSGGSTIQAGRLPILDARDVRSHRVLAQVRDKFLHVIALVGAERLGVNVPSTCASEQLPRGTVLGLGRFGDEDVDAQPIAVLHEHMPAIAELGRLAVALAHESRLGIGRALMRGVRALLALEVDHPGAVITVLGRGAILGLEALERSPGIDQRAVDREVVRGQQLLLAGQIDDLIEEASSDVGGDKAFAQPAEVRLVQRRALEIHVEKPTEQDVVVELFAELPVRANRIQRNQQLRLEQSLWRNRWATDRGVQRVQLPRNCAQGTVGQTLHPSQRMIRRHTRLRREVVEHRGLGVELAAHRCRTRSLEICL